jgi:glycosyltransferase involved in cell wall biosynthesis
VSLPAEAETPTPEDLADARERFLVPGLPLVLVVGSHEPRKNHLAVLHAAERRWRAGDRFSLTFIGGNSWGSAGFSRRLAELQALGRPVETASRVPDRLLWAAYRLARVTVFPSLNEGFGLPVAESLASGTPVITSAYGSMREIADGGGALLVDPRDDTTIAAALHRVLEDDALHTSLVSAARARPHRTWDDYAADVWELLTADARTGPHR